MAESDRLQPRESVAAAGATRADREVVAHQLAATTSENRRTTHQTRALLLAAAGGEPSDAVVVWRHAAKDRGTAVAGGIGGLQSAANFGDDFVAERNVSAESIRKMIFPWVGGPPDVKPTPPRTTGNTAD
jgi:hypothetical protein